MSKPEQSVKERTIRAGAWLLIIGLLMAGGYWRRAQAEKRRKAAVSDLHESLNRINEAVVALNNEVGDKVQLSVDGIMGTKSSVTVWGLPAAEGKAAGEAVLQIFRDVDTQFSTWKDDSEISKLNAAAADGPVECSPRMWELLSASRTAWERSGGGFDVTAGPLMRLWGFYRKRQSLPSETEVAEAAAKVGLDKVIFDDTAKTVQFSVPGMNIDFGGIAKGWALDLAKVELERRGVATALVDLGGNVLVLGTPPAGQDVYRIGIRHPRDRNGTVTTIGILDASVATSGDYERFVEIDGRRYAHIMDPRTGRPIEGMSSVTVVARTGLASDLVSTAIFVSPDRAEALMAEYDCLGILIIRPDAAGELQVTELGEVWQSMASE